MKKVASNIGRLRDIIGIWIYIVARVYSSVVVKWTVRVSVISRKAKGTGHIWKRSSNYLHEKCPNIHTSSVKLVGVIINGLKFDQ